jgi:hypothetical protein
VISKGTYIAEMDDFPASRERPGSDTHKGYPMESAKALRRKMANVRGVFVNMLSM